jgi:uncharacterized protein YcbX
MRILFYLPIATQHWLENLLPTLIRRAAREAEVHIVVPIAWNGTGIDGSQLQRWIDAPEIRWHILDGPDHPSFRTTPENPQALIDFIRAIDADYTFCRSADIVTPEQFPGKVRYLMEGDYPPLLGDGRPHSERIMVTGPGVLNHGMMPPLEYSRRSWLRESMAPLWSEYQARHGDFSSEAAAYIAAAGLPSDRKILAVPLESESVTNFFHEAHCEFTKSDQFVADLAARIDDDMVLAVTPHPLWVWQPPAMRDAIAARLQRIASMNPDKVRLVLRPGNPQQLTRWLIHYADGVIARDSKTLTIGAFLGKPCLRLSPFACGEWMQVYRNIAAFQHDIRSGTARSAALADALAWFGFHHANEAFVPWDRNQTLAMLLDRVDRPVDPERWEANLDRHRRDFANWFQAPLRQVA